MLELFRRMWVGWQGVAKGILAAQNFFLMAVAYFVGVGPVAVGMRLAGRKMLDTEPADPQAPTYWLPRDGAPITMDRAARPF